MWNAECKSETGMNSAFRTPHSALALALVIATAFSPAHAADPGWPCWRGPTRQGIAVAAKLPREWSDSIKPLWEAKLGTGWSSPVVAEGRMFVTDRIDDTERVLAFDAKTGRELWTRSDPVSFDPHSVGARHGNGPKSTPAVSQGRVYSLGIAGRLLCLDAQRGRLIWQINFPEVYGEHRSLAGGKARVIGTECVLVPIGNGEGAPAPLFGYTGSPLVTDSLVVCSVGGARGGTIMAFDAATGDEVWRSLHENVSYSSPISATLGGVEQVVVMTGPEIVGLELATGRKLWGHPFQIQYDESISTPVAADGYVLATGDGHPLTAIRIEQRAGRWSVDVAWENRDLSSYLSSMVIHDARVYGMNDGGEFACLRLTDGQTVWLGGHHGFYCTPVLVNDRLLCLNERGELQVLAATPEKYQPIAAARLTDRATWTSPAIAGSRIFVRGDKQLRAFEP